MQEIKIKPCPFCGGDAELQSADFKGAVWFVVCHKCEIKTFFFSSPAKAARRWNRRAKNGV